MAQQRICANSLGLPPASPNILSQKDWNEMADAIDLARDALGDGPQDVDEAFLWNNIIHLRMALKLAHKRSEKKGLVH